MATPRWRWPPPAAKGPFSGALALASFLIEQGAVDETAVHEALRSLEFRATAAPAG